MMLFFVCLLLLLLSYVQGSCRDEGQCYDYIVDGSIASSDARWSLGCASLNFERTDTLVESFAFMVGGVSNDGRKDTYKFTHGDSDTFQPRQLASRLTGAHSDGSGVLPYIYAHSAFVATDYADHNKIALYVAGGRRDTAGTNTNEVWRLPITYTTAGTVSITQDWNRIGIAPFTARSGLSAVVNPAMDIVTFVGGYSGGTANDVWQWQPKIQSTNALASWRQLSLSSDPFVGCRHLEGVGLVHSETYPWVAMIGGIGAYGYRDDSDIRFTLRYCTIVYQTTTTLSTVSCHAGPDGLMPRAYASVAIDRDDNVFVLGGFTYDSRTSIKFPANNPDNKLWISRVTTPRISDVYTPTWGTWRSLTPSTAVSKNYAMPDLAQACVNVRYVRNYAKSAGLMSQLVINYGVEAYGSNRRAYDQVVVSPWVNYAKSSSTEKSPYDSSSLPDVPDKKVDVPVKQNLAAPVGAPVGTAGGIAILGLLAFCLKKCCGKSEPKPAAVASPPSVPLSSITTAPASPR